MIFDSFFCKIGLMEKRIELIKSQKINLITLAATNRNHS